MLIVIILILAVLLAIVIYMLARAVNQIIFLREDLQSATDHGHAKCMGAMMRFVGNEFAAQILEVAAQDYDSVEETTTKTTLARTQYREGGPSMPSLWLRHRAEKLRILADPIEDDVQPKPDYLGLDQ